MSRYAWKYGLLQVILCGLSVVGPGVAEGVAQTAPQAAPQSEVDMEFNEVAARASALYAEGKYDEAIATFESAYAIKPQSNILYNIGRIQEKKGDFEQATMYYEKFINEPDIELAARQDALARLKALNEVLALRKKPEPSPEPATAATLTEVKEEVVAGPPIQEPVLKARSQVVPWTLMGVGAASLITGAVFGVSSGREYEVVQQTEDLERRRDAQSTGRTHALIADTSMIAGGMLLTTGAALYVWRRRASDARQVTIAPALGKSSQGVSLSLSF